MSSSGSPTWATGNVPGPDDFNSWFQPISVIKLADTSRASNATLSNDPDLALPFEANAAYWFSAYLLYTAANGGDIQWTFTGFSGGATLRYAPVRNNLSNSFNGAFADTGGTTEMAAGQGSSTLANAVLIGTLQTGTAGGTMTLQWAQNSSVVTATVMKAQSAMMLQRIG